LNNTRKSFSSVLIVHLASGWFFSSAFLIHFILRTIHFVTSNLESNLGLCTLRAIFLFEKSQELIDMHAPLGETTLE